MKQHLALGVGVGVFTGVRVMVIQGRNLPSKDVNRLSDPFVKVQIGETKKKTKVPFFFFSFFFFFFFFFFSFLLLLIIIISIPFLLTPF